MLNKDLSQRPQCEIPWESKTHSNAHAYTQRVTRRYHTLTHSHSPMPNVLCQCHIFSKPWPSPSSHPPGFTDTHPHTLPPLFTSPLLFNPLVLMSSHYSTKRAPQGPWASVWRHLLVPLDGHLTQILSTAQLSVPPSSWSLLLPGTQGATLAEFSFYSTGCCFLVTCGRPSSTWPLKAGIPHTSSLLFTL